MKFRNIAIIGLFCLVAISMQEANPCVNVFTDRIKADPDTSVQSLALSTAATYTGTICSTEWSNYGTCCNKDKIIEVGEKRINDWKLRLTKFAATAEDFAKKMAERKDHIMLQIKTVDALITSKAEDATFNQKISPEAKAQVQSLAQGAERLINDNFEPANFKDNMDKFKSGINMCFVEVNKFRLGQFCSTCSTRAANFVDVNGKIIISEAACVKIVSACVHTWRFMFNMIQTIKTLVQVPKIKNFETQTGTAVPPVTTNTGADTSADVNAINADLDAVANLDTSTLVFSDSVKNLCEKLLTFDRPNKETEDPDNTRMEEAMAEQKKEEEFVKSLPAVAKALLDGQMEQMKAQMETKRQQDATEITARTAELNTAITAAKTEMDARKVDIQALRTDIETMKTAIANETVAAEKQKKTDALILILGELKVKTDAIETANKNVQVKLSLVMEKCGSGAKCPEAITKIKDFNTKFATEKTQQVDLLANEQKKVLDKMMEEVKPLKDEIKVKLDTLKLKHDQSVTALATYNNAPETGKAIPLANLQSINAAIATLKTEIGQRLEKIKAFEAKVATFLPPLKEEFQRTNQPLQDVLKPLAEGITGSPPQARILSQAPASGGVGVNNNGASDYVVAEGEAPTSQITIDINSPPASTTPGLSVLTGPILALIALFLMNVSF